MSLAAAELPAHSQAASGVMSELGLDFGVVDLIPPPGEHSSRSPPPAKGQLERDSPSPFGGIANHIESEVSGAPRR